MFLPLSLKGLRLVLGNKPDWAVPGVTFKTPVLSEKSFGISPKLIYLYLIASGASFLTSKTLNLFSLVICSDSSTFFLNII